MSEYCINCNYELENGDEYFVVDRDYDIIYLCSEPCVFKVLDVRTRTFEAEEE